MTILLAVLLVVGTATASPLAVCATIPDLGDLVREVGGEQVTVTTLSRGDENPHDVRATPSAMQALGQAGLLVVNGLALEARWLPVMLQSVHNPRIQPGTPGYLDASTVIKPIGVPAKPATDLQRDTHGLGNPHYLLDPIRGLRVAAAIRDALIKLRPDAASEITAHHDAFRDRLGAKLVGQRLASTYDVEKLIALVVRRRLSAFLERGGQSDLLRGWVGLLAGNRGVAVVADHDTWPYFAQRFGIEIAGILEPRPSAPPTGKHLASIVQVMRRRNVRVILTITPSDQQDARMLAEATGATLVPMAHLVGARPEAGDYLAMLDLNVTALAAALAP